MSDGKKSTVPPQIQRKIDQIAKKALLDFKPTEKEMEIMTSYANQIMLRLKKVVPKDVEIISAGSVARGTQLRGSSDIDIFLLFPKSVSPEQLRKKGLEYGKRIVQKRKNESFMIKYAEHPYVQLLLSDMGIKADIVPARKITDSKERVTAVDRTQLHNKYVNSHLTKKQRDDVITLKAFLKAHNIYGAQAKTEGFSGYLCELLVSHWGSFADVLANIARVNIPFALEPLINREHHGKEAIIFARKFNSRFIVIDPTDSNRNVAAVVSDESLARFIIISKIMLSNPSAEFFYGAKHSEDYSERKIASLRKELGLNVYLLHFKVPEIAQDIIWQQLKRLSKRLQDDLQKASFKPALTLENAEGTDAIIAFFIHDMEIKYEIAAGPTPYMGRAIEKFIGAHKKSLGVFLEKDRIMSIEESKYTVPEELLKDLLKKIDTPSYLEKKKMKMYKNALPEPLAKLLYIAFVAKTNL